MTGCVPITLFRETINGKDHILCVIPFICVPRTGKSTETESSFVAARDWWKGAMQVMGAGFLFGVMKIFWY